MMATTSETYVEQQLCDYALLKHVEVAKDADVPDKVYKKWTKLWVVVHCEISPITSFLGYCKKENKWLLDNQAVVKYPLHTVTLSKVNTKKHENVLQLEFPSQTVQVCFDSMTKMDHYYQLLQGVTARHHVDLVRSPEHPEREGDYVIEECPESYKAWKGTGRGDGRLCWEWFIKCVRRIQFHKTVEKLEVEVGRMAETGEGHFFFTGRHAERLFLSMKEVLLNRARQRQQTVNQSLPPSHGVLPVGPPRSKSFNAHHKIQNHQLSSHRMSNYQHPISTHGIPSRVIAASEDSETSSEEYSPSDNSSSYTGTGSSAQDWPIMPYTPSSTPGSMECVPSVSLRADSHLRDRDACSPSSSSTSSSTSGYQYPRQMVHPSPDPKPHYMKVDRRTMDNIDDDYMTMNKINFQKLTITDDEYTDMKSATGKIDPLYDVTPEDSAKGVPGHYTGPTTERQTGTLTRNASEPLLDQSSSSPPPLPPHASLRLRESDAIPSNILNSNTFPGTRREHK